MRGDVPGKDAHGMVRLTGGLPAAVVCGGGMVTARPPAVLKAGQWSAICNLRCLHPGFKTRAGQAQAHATADGTNAAVSLYQFVKGRRTERHLLAQMSDGDILKASDSPPSVSVGVFGTELFDGTATGQIPAAWATLNDVCLWANGSDQVRLWAGQQTAIDAFVVFKGTATPGLIPDGGQDYTTEVRDAGAATVAVLDSLDTFANHHCVYLGFALRPKQVDITMAAGNANASTATIYYNANGTMTQITLDGDTTASGGAALAQTGSWTFSPPAAWVPTLAFGRVLFWLQARFSAALDAEVEVSKVTYDCDPMALVAAWDGVSVDPVEVVVYDDDTVDTYYHYAPAAVDISELPTTGRVYFFTADPISAYYVDVGDTPNANSLTISEFGRWIGSAFATDTPAADGSSGLTQSGWVVVNRNADDQPRQFRTNKYQAYCYYFKVSAAVSADVNLAIATMPWFDIADWGTAGYCVAAWKDRALYVFNQDPHLIHVSAVRAPLVLAGDDATILTPGDGRAHPVRAIVLFFSEILVFQEERGQIGGTITLYQGYNPSTFGKRVLSTRHGTFNAASVDVVEGVFLSAEADALPRTVAYALGHAGVLRITGTTVDIVSDDINNYFDPSSADCIRAGYEDKMWLKWDAAEKLVRVGLVTGTTATACNTFLEYDPHPVYGGWRKTQWAHPLACFANIEAASGAVAILQVAGGTADGRIYRVNTGTADVNTAIEASCTCVLNNNGVPVRVNAFAPAFAAAAGTVTAQLYDNGLAYKTALALPMAADKAGQSVRRHHIEAGMTSTLPQLKLSCAVKDQVMTLHTIGVDLAAETLKRQ